MASLGRYEIIKPIGTGGMGIVLLARESAAAALVAIKLLKPQFIHEPRAVHRFLIEARHMQRMAHPNILTVLDVSDRPEGPYFVCPFMERGSLATLVQPGVPLDEFRVRQIARDIAEALSYAHRRGIIHRDLKPGNVLLDSAGRAYLADFGLLRTVFNDSLVDVRRDQCEGTAPYMSPATAAGQAEDTRCDIYSFGALLYEMLTGHPPYEGNSPQQIIQQILSGPPSPIRARNPRAHGNLTRVAEGSMARELRDRYASMSDVVADLERIEGHRLAGPRNRTRPVVNRKLSVISIPVFLLAALFWAYSPAFRVAGLPARGKTVVPVQQRPFIVIRDDSGDPDDRRVILSDTQVGEVSPPSHFMLANDGLEELVVLDLRVEGRSPPSFEVQMRNKRAQHDGSRLTIRRGESCTLEVRLHPTSLGVHADSVILITNDPNDREIKLTLHGYAKSTPANATRQGTPDAAEKRRP